MLYQDEIFLVKLIAKDMSKAKFVSGEIENAADITGIFDLICQKHGIDPAAKKAEYKTDQVKMIGLIRLASELKVKIELDFAQTPGKVSVIYMEPEKGPKGPPDEDAFPLG